MALTDTRIRTLKPKSGKTERLVAGGNGLYIRVRAWWRDHPDVAVPPQGGWPYRDHHARHLSRTIDQGGPSQGRRAGYQTEDVQPDGGRGGREVAEGTHRPHS